MQLGQKQYRQWTAMIAMKRPTRAWLVCTVLALHGGDVSLDESLQLTGITVGRTRSGAASLPMHARSLVSTAALRDDFSNPIAAAKTQYQSDHDSNS
jgi:hypothetical protein